MRATPDDRMVRACTECPTTTPSKRRPPRWATVARQVAAAVGAEPAAVRAALAAALTTERQRWLPTYSAVVAAEQGAVATYL